ncbi:threonine/serine dehydratase [Rhodospirillaceae bacterium KN72]|uniref:Threonine/serine dehydratase n=1 Tax=Pacificispira spongiicola TaxID=2729598 RepID=A0A7Y0DYZ8_9PROT|nr:threonine/serine dehydratase [Pacificispira spongiicola]NMM44192.1 threonine/serine dehydratase [Pacificispira spongiicola]
MPFSPLSPDDAPVFDDILAAQQRLHGITIRTPLLESPLLNDRIGRRILIKPECLQTTGSFKFRGASNRIRALKDDELAGGVVAFSSGNHAQGVAAAARQRGIDATIIMPSDAPAIKKANTEAWGATVVTYDRFTENREEIGTRIAEDRGATLIRPYDDPFVIAGQGTIGLEIAAQLDEIGAAADIVITPCGGGGLISGTALALSGTKPEIAVFGAEPEDFDDTRRSLESGNRETVNPSARSICDSILTPQPGVLTWAINSRLLKGIVPVSDEQALAAMKTAFLDLKLVAEPGGATSLAAALSGDLPPGDGAIVAVISGGNVDPETFRRALA